MTQRAMRYGRQVRGDGHTGCPRLLEDGLAAGGQSAEGYHSNKRWIR